MKIRYIIRWVSPIYKSRIYFYACHYFRSSSALSLTFISKLDRSWEQMTTQKSFDISPNLSLLSSTICNYLISSNTRVAIKSFFQCIFNNLKQGFSFFNLKTFHLFGDYTFSQEN